MINNHVKVMIGAEGFEPLAGWPYQMGLTALNDNEINDDLKELSTRIVQDYTTFYTDYQAAGVSVDQAACDLGESRPFDESGVEFFAGTREQLNNPDETKVADIRNALILAHWEAQPYLGQKYVDLYDFCHLLKETMFPADLNADCWMRITGCLSECAEHYPRSAK